MAEIALRLVVALRAMEQAGVRMHKGRFGEIKTKVDEEIARLEREVWDLAGGEFVLGSPQQLGHVLFEKLNLSKKRKGKTGFSTDARVLQAIRDEHPIIPLIERWRELNQLAKTYLDVLPALADAEDRTPTTSPHAPPHTRARPAHAPTRGPSNPGRSRAAVPGSARPSCRPPRRPAGWPARTRTCRTSRC